jgi:hypothetical protein
MLCLYFCPAQEYFYLPVIVVSLHACFNRKADDGILFPSMLLQGHGAQFIPFDLLNGVPALHVKANITSFHADDYSMWRYYFTPAGPKAHALWNLAKAAKGSTVARRLAWGPLFFCRGNWILFRLNILLDLFLLNFFSLLLFLIQFSLAFFVCSLLLVRVHPSRIIFCMLV